MQQFDLSIWLQDKSRKVVTRDGRSVRIICTDYQNAYKSSRKIIALVQEKGFDNEILHYYNEHGIEYLSDGDRNIDLFFADEEEELTEFEKTMIQFSHERNSLIQFEHTTEEINTHLYRCSKKLLDLARKELEKDLPKWKKATEHKDLEKNIAILEDGKVLLSNYLEKGDYYIDLEDLKTLPKEK